MAVKHKCREPQGADRLGYMLRALQNVESSLHGAELAKHCESIVLLLGTVPVPQTLKEYVNFMSNVEELLEFLSRACSCEELILITLKALYNGISDETQKNPSPTMSIVLQLINVQFIPTAVNHILQCGYSEKKLEQSLVTLCKWLTKWTCTPNLGPLVFHFMKGLESERYYDILIDVTLEYVEKLFKMLILKETRQHIRPVVIYMLSSFQHSPEAFHKVIPHVPNVLKSLHAENSEASQIHLAELVNLCMNLMAHFASAGSNYDDLKRTLEVYNHGKTFQSINYKSWLIGVDALVPIRHTLGRVGLNNLGNTCYMNSVLQALFMTKLFRNDLLSSKKDCVPLISKLQTLFVLLQFSHKASLSPGEILNLARPPGFLQGHQHDSSEFMGYLLDILHEQERSIFAANNEGEAGDGPYVTVVQRSYGGRTLTVSQCGNCGNQSERADHFRELQLSFPPESCDQSVESLLEYYFQPEKLCDDNQYHCDKCHRLTDSERVTKVVEFPHRLVLTLKQFRYDPTSQSRTKLLQRVQLNAFVTLDSGEEYELYAVVVHCGSSLDSGHYYTFARDGDDWYKFNDCAVTATTHQELFSLKPPETPYILFYKKLDALEPESLEQGALSAKLQAVLSRDHAESEVERKRRLLRINGYSRPDKEDDPPPPSCGGGGFNDSSSKLVC